jgi:hypothetical protein
MLKQQEADDTRMCAFFANVKSSLLWHWEHSIVAKSESFRRQSDKSELK